MKIAAPVTTPDSTNAKTRVTNIIANTLEIKTATIQMHGQPDQTINYVLGDIFHSDPVLVDRPNDFNFYTVEPLRQRDGASTAPTTPVTSASPSSRAIAARCCSLGTNDGQLHAIDAGVWDNATQTFTDGTGKEIFSYMPRLALPIVRDQAEKARQIFSVDGTPRVDDVFLDPNHTAGAAVATDREWRTVAIGGFREGGSIDGGGRVGDFVSGYYALDVTHPDKLDCEQQPDHSRPFRAASTTDNSVASGCGTLPFPAVLWEFTDSVGTSQLDEDKNGYPDLGQTWSVPTIGRIKVIEGGQHGRQVRRHLRRRHGRRQQDQPEAGQLALHGGHRDRADDLQAQARRRRAVGRRRLDVDLDGYLDTIYIGTICGLPVQGGSITARRRTCRT